VTLLNFKKFQHSLLSGKKLSSLMLSIFFFWSGMLAARSDFKLGIDHLEERGFDILADKRVGLLTHPAGKNARGMSTVRIFHQSPHVNLVALFGPEHGIYGDEKASVPVDDKVDHRTNLPVFSLYGKYRKPTAKMLSGIDCLVVDLQDVGVRCYTYISCMKYAMEACFESGKEVIILDRPNPLGGLKMAGPMIDLEWISYVGAFPIPFVHGMTIAEIALWSKKKPGVLKLNNSFRKAGKLSIVPMTGWRRSMTWPETKLKWHPTSPNIPTLDAVAGYPMTGLGAQLGGFSHGIGTRHPFRFLSFEGKSADVLKSELELLNIPGLSYKILDLKDATGKLVQGVYLVVNDWKKWNPTELAFAMMSLSAKWQTPSPFLGVKKSESNLFNKHVGSTEWWNYLQSAKQDVDRNRFSGKWAKEVNQFRYSVQPFLLY
jgi:uncharacterized protein YbbC (DUF1343 family)